MKRRLILAVACCALGGCGPIVVPMFSRPSEEGQRAIDDAWRNVLTPVDRTDRDTLLGVMTVYQLFTVGIDRAEYRAEKRVGDLRVVMEVHFDRTQPEVDQFHVLIFRADGALARAESYSRSDVEAYLRMDAMRHSGTSALSRPSASEEQEERDERLKSRWQAIQAATQPAGSIPPPP
jgi:hypothetical protein